MSVSIDGHEEVAAELLRESREGREEVRKVLSKGALNVKRDMSEDARSNGSYQHFHQSINYDIDEAEMEAEIGPDKNKAQGALGNILYFGTSNNAPVLDLNAGLNKEQPRFDRAMERVVRDVLS